MSILVKVKSLGKIASNVPVKLNYRVIELFSQGLYRSPYKPIEELVINGFDAFAASVNIVMKNVEGEGGFIAVIDDGSAMNPEEMNVLWRIGYSPKRGAEYQEVASKKGRLPIGRFGIGKLAPFVLSRHLIHVCRKDGNYYALDMDFTRLDESVSDIETEALNLELRELTEQEAKDLIADVVSLNDRTIPLFGRGSSKSWTVAVMADLRELAQTLSEAKLRYIVSTALPITPDFKVFISNAEVEPYYAKGQRVWESTIGANDKAADVLKLEVDINESLASESGKFGVEIPGIGRIWGKVEVYKDSLVGKDRKSDRIQRSHGIFVMVLGRLVNLDDPLFGLSPRSHKTFNRFRMVIHADGLDRLLRSSRESVFETSEVEEGLLPYIARKFEEARGEYEEWLRQEEAASIKRLPPSLIREPLSELIWDAVRAHHEGRGSRIEIPPEILEAEDESIESWIDGVSGKFSSLTSVVREGELGPEGPIAKFDVSTFSLILNSSHPLVMYFDSVHDGKEFLTVWALAEVLLEAYLLESGLNHELVTTVLNRRDTFFRKVVGLGTRSALIVAAELRQAKSDPAGLEEQVAEALRILGFEVNPIGGKGEADGLAYIALGIRGSGESGYKFTYDAKSTKNKKYKAINITRLNTHRVELGADYCLVVTPDVPKGVIWDEATSNGMICLCRIEDLAEILEISTRFPVGFSEFKSMLVDCRTPDEVHQWVQVLSRKVDENRTQEILTIILKGIKELQEDDKFQSHVTLDGLYARVYEEAQIDKPSLGKWVEVLSRIVPEIVIYDQDGRIYLDAPPDDVLRHARNRLAGK